ncbi:MAG: histidine phosphatase family protein [Stagnimonas sp.]|nr:histidine phosphatase family protein [Stagnimonas sp.]
MSQALRLSSLLLLACASFASQAAPQLVILVRHAEKAAEPREDPTLSEVGTARAKALAQTLADAKVGAVLTSPLRRTRDTGTPVAEAVGIKPQAIGFEGGTVAHVAAVAAAVRAQAVDTVLVVGHSNTVPAIVAALGGPKLADFCESSFDQLLLLRLDSEPPRLLRARYGLADPVAAAGCSP